MSPGPSPPPCARLDVPSRRPQPQGEALNHRLFVMPSRRSVLASLLASTLGLPLAGPAAALVGGGGPEIRRYGRFVIVNGWVLTAADLELLGLHAG
jgi:hypothetical protein